MPIISTSDYRPTLHLFNGHLETVVPSLFRKISDVAYVRERLELVDGDFLDLDWMQQNRSQLIIISHGLEGSSERHYAKGMARYFFQRGWDALAWNCRSCSSEINRLPRLYHHAASDDLRDVIRHATKKNYETIVLVGFSMGGSLSLKYLGETTSIMPQLKACVVFSVPCHLGSSARRLDEPGMRFYRKRFLKKLGKKIEQKARQFPNLIRYDEFDKIKYFEEFDERYTAPLHGFKNAADFYDKASAQHYLPAIHIPTLIVNAANDPFLPEACYPKQLAATHADVHLEIPKRGGHTGFPLFNRNENWMEQRAFDFIHSVL